MTRPAALLNATLIVVALIAAACSSPGSQPGAGDEPFTADVGCDQRMDAAIRAWADRGIGAAIVDIGGDRECVAAYGLADRETGRENTVDTVFAIGSITKPFTAAAIYDLIDDGVLTLDDTAGQHVPGLGGDAADATIRDLLLHTSGITGEHGFDHVPQTKDDAVASLSRLGLAFDPGSNYLYANSNYTVLALIVDAVTEQGYRRYVTDEIAHDRTGEPLGGWWDGEPAPVGPRAWGYDGDRPAEQRGDAPGPHWAMEGNGLMAMSVLEMAEWTRALFTGQILSPAATEMLLNTSSVLAEEPEIAGWSVIGAARFGEPVIATAGGGSGIGHEMSVGWFPESGRVLVVAQNASDVDVPFFTYDIVDALVVGTGIPPPPAVPEVDPALLNAAAGTYRIGDSGQLTVDEADGGLQVTMTGTEAIAALFPVPADEADRVADHERAALDFVRGSTPEARRQFDLLEDRYGALRRATVDGTIFDGALETQVRLEFENFTAAAGVSVDAAGDVEFGHRAWPAEVVGFLVHDDGVFRDFFPDDVNPVVSLRVSDNGIEIEGPDGAQQLSSDS